MLHLLDFVTDSTPVCVTKGSCLCYTYWILLRIPHMYVLLLKDFVYVTPVEFCYG